MSTQIVIVNASITAAPEPATLQESGALISAGGTILAPGTSSLLTQLSDLTPLLPTPNTILSLAWSGGVVMAVSVSSAGMITGSLYWVIVAGAVPTAYNGIFLATALGYASEAVASATYNTSTGILALTFASAPFGAGVGATLDGANVTVLGLAGTSVAPLNGTWPITGTASAGTVISLQATIGLGSLTITSATGTLQAGVTGFSYALPANPGAETAPGTWTPRSSSELTQMATTFFAQGSGIGVNVLELGIGTVNQAIAALSTYIAANPNTNYIDGAQGFYYGYLIPREWDGNANFLALIAQYEATTSKTYFWTTTTLATYQNYLAVMKDVIALIEAPAYGPWAANTLTAISWTSNQVTATTTSAHGVAVGQWFQIQGCLPVGYNGWAQAQLGTTGSTLVWNLATNPGAETQLGTLEQSLYFSAGKPQAEFSLAADFQHTLNYAPSSTNKVTPNAFSFLFGVTPFPTQGNASLFAALAAANTNWIATANEGGLSNTIMYYGTTKDGNDFSVWYSIDWVQINSDIAAANAVIDGNNDSINPLYYNQPGINTVQSVLASVLSTGVSFGLVFGAPVQTELNQSDFDAAINTGTYPGLSVMNAQPFVDWQTANPDTYQTGQYGGYSSVYTPNVGFRQIIYDVNVSFFPGQV